MLSVKDVLRAIDAFTPEERAEIPTYLENISVMTPPSDVVSPPPLDRDALLAADWTLDMDALNAGLAELREGVSEAEFAEIEAAMNHEYIEPVEDDE